MTTGPFDGVEATEPEVAADSEDAELAHAARLRLKAKADTHVGKASFCMIYRLPCSDLQPS
jgi:hypothetical protein